MSAPRSVRLHPSLSHPFMRGLYADSGALLTAGSLMFPLFISDMDYSSPQPIPSFGDIPTLSVGTLIPYLTPLVARGLRAVLLFPVIEKHASAKCPTGLSVLRHSPIPDAIRLLRSSFPSLYIACDICLCAYTSHGHCGVPDGFGGFDPSLSLASLRAVASPLAQAGCNMLAPSDMMDNRIAALVALLEDLHLRQHVSVMSYSAKFASCLYGPFRDAAHSSPSLPAMDDEGGRYVAVDGMYRGRKNYQLPCDSRMLARRALQRDWEEGADVLMVKPAGVYLDVVREARDGWEVPVAAYHVSGEYMMIKCAAEKGVVGMREVVMETMVAVKRAGAALIITYFVPEILDWLNE